LDFLDFFGAVGLEISILGSGTWHFWSLNDFLMSEKSVMLNSSETALFDQFLKFRFRKKQSIPLV